MYTYTHVCMYTHIVSCYHAHTYTHVLSHTRIGSYKHVHSHGWHFVGFLEGLCSLISAHMGTPMWSPRVLCDLTSAVMSLASLNLQARLLEAFWLWLGGVGKARRSKFFSGTLGWGCQCLSVCSSGERHCWLSASCLPLIPHFLGLPQKGDCL